MAGWVHRVMTESLMLRRWKGIRCVKCRKKFEVGDKVHSKGTIGERVYYCDPCYESLYVVC